MSPILNDRAHHKCLKSILKIDNNFDCKTSAITDLKYFKVIRVYFKYLFPSNQDQCQ